MSFEEKRAWIFLLVAIGGYATYLGVILGRADASPVTEMAYAATLLWSIGAAIVASIALVAVAAFVSAEGVNHKDQRDREIHRFGEYVGQSFVILGGVVALGMALAEWDHFWIANAIYAAFVLSAILGSVAKIVAYRRGFQPW